jgi:hypothetical protein
MIKEKLDEVIISIEKATDLFYQNKVNEGYKQFENTLLVLTDTINDIFQYKIQGNEIGIEESRLINVLTEAMNAMEAKDALLLSDILNYELKELFHQVVKTISLN